MSKKPDTLVQARTSRWAVAVLGAVVLAAAAGAVAAAVRDDAPGVAFAVFAAVTVAPAFGALSVALGLFETAQPEHHEDSVEHQWLERACAGAFLDVVIVLGVAVTVTSLLAVAPVPPVLVLGLAMGDAAVRYAVLVRRAG